MTGDPIIEDQAVEWFARLRDLPVQDSVKAEFAQWKLADPAHARAYDEICALWSDLDGLDLSADREPVGAGAADEQIKVAARSGWTWRLMSMAAAIPLLALLGTATLLPEGGPAALLADARTARGEIRTVDLPDGSTAVLDGSSALSFDMSGPERRVTLVAGRAFFRVRHLPAQPFSVSAGDAVIRDIGTAFEVSRLPQGNLVSVQEGRVEALLSGKAPHLLGAGEALSANGADSTRVRENAVASWRSHRLVFENMPLGQVLGELGRYRGGWIVVTDRAARDRRLTGSVDTAQPDEALQAIAGMAGLSETRLGPVTLLQRD
ncbi:FecR domain-containing protein [Sphingomonas sp.]|uniref:FecR family protein n=1 Tax=Sphingomonas sp. TaxID=28214 RepID=UPI0025E9413B|nr:FecR domain-containing protein [Sphingomonas sp.]